MQMNVEVPETQFMDGMIVQLNETMEHYKNSPRGTIGWKMYEIARTTKHHMEAAKKMYTTKFDDDEYWDTHKPV